MTCPIRFNESVLLNNANLLKNNNNFYNFFHNSFIILSWLARYILPLNMNVYYAFIFSFINKEEC